MIERENITIRATRDRLHCPSANDPSMGSNLEIQYKAYITGKSTIKPGDLNIDFIFEGKAPTQIVLTQSVNEVDGLH